ncbi:hypothetical protein ACFVUN_35905 [Kitasatospora griseola]|uniref:hypothetical protein n=1 Tax=Kitasatospora griseola TaxID=2064 RepID=UPI0036D8AB9F
MNPRPLTAGPPAADGTGQPLAPTALLGANRGEDPSVDVRVDDGLQQPTQLGRIDSLDLPLVLTDALHNQAALAGDGPANAKLVARSILLAIHAFTDADDQDALTLLRAPRNEVLQVG